MEKKKILLIDDNLDFISMLKIRLEKSGYLVLSAASGEEGIKIVQANNPDLVIIDVLMPKMDGLTTMKEINRISGRKIPIIIMTGDAVMTRDAFELEGAKDFLIKPIDSIYLMNRLRELLNQNQQSSGGVA